MFRQASKKQTNKHHDRSLDDFVKNLKRNNLKSERYDRLMSPDPFAPYRNNTAHTLQRSRTLSGKHSRKTNKTTRQKVQRMLAGSFSKEKHRSSASKIASKTNSSKLIANPADLISSFSKRIRQTQHFLTGKSKMGLLLCRKFLQMLNEIVQNMVLNLQQNLQELEKSISQRVQKEIGERAQKKVNALQKKLGKLERETQRLLQKQNYNSNLIYHLRLNSKYLVIKKLMQIDNLESVSLNLISSVVLAMVLVKYQIKRMKVNSSTKFLILSLQWQGGGCKKKIITIYKINLVINSGNGHLENAIARISYEIYHFLSNILYKCLFDLILLVIFASLLIKQILIQIQLRQAFMGIFSTLFRGLASTIKYGTYAGSLYTFLGYFYVQQIKHRLGDSKECWKQDYQLLNSSINSDQTGEGPNFIVEFATLIVDVYTFYARTWLYRQFQKDCKKFHKTIVTSILNNYEEYGVLNNKKQMQQQINKNEVNPATITKILHVKQLNAQLTNLYANEYLKIIGNQINLRTGAIIGVSEEQKQNISLIYNYFEKGERLIFQDQEKYWQYKLVQKQTRKHRYNDTIFKLIFI